MANVLIQDTTLKAIANAIRGKTGETGSMKPSTMAGKINLMITASSMNIFGLANGVEFSSNSGTLKMIDDLHTTRNLEYYELYSDFSNGYGLSNIKSILYANGLFLIGTENGLRYTIDGTTVGYIDNVSSGYFSALCYDDGLWVAGEANGASGLWYSTDGKTWTQSNLTDVMINSICHADGLWMACGSNNTVVYSIDGKTWVENNPTILNTNYYAVYHKNGIWILASASGLLYSTNGLSWTKSNITSGFFYSICYGNGVFVAAGINGVYSSTNGMAWSLKSSVNSREVYYANGIFILGTASAGIYYSLNGTSWTQSDITSDAFGNTEYKTLYYANGLFIAASKTSGIYYSADGKHWIQSNITSGESRCPMFGGTRWLVTNGSKLVKSIVKNASVFYSEDTCKTNSPTRLTFSSTTTKPTSNPVLLRCLDDPHVWYMGAFTTYIDTDLSERIIFGYISKITINNNLF